MGSNSGAYFNAVTIASGENTKKTTEIKPEQLGRDASVSGIVQRDTTNYDVNLIWLDEQGNELITESVASGVTAGNQTSFDVAARSHRCIVEVADAGSGSGDVDGSAQIS